MPFWRRELRPLIAAKNHLSLPTCQSQTPHFSSWTPIQVRWILVNAPQGHWSNFLIHFASDTDIALFRLFHILIDARFVVKERPNFSDMPASDST